MTAKKSAPKNPKTTGYKYYAAGADNYIIKLDGRNIATVNCPNAKEHAVALCAAMNNTYGINISPGAVLVLKEVANTITSLYEKMQKCKAL